MTQRVALSTRRMCSRCTACSPVLSVSSKSTMPVSVVDVLSDRRRGDERGAFRGRADDEVRRDLEHRRALCDQRAFDQVHELAHVARPGVAHQPGHGVGSTRSIWRPRRRASFCTQCCTSGAMSSMRARSGGISRVNTAMRRTGLRETPLRARHGQIAIAGGDQPDVRRAGFAPLAGDRPQGMLSSRACNSEDSAPTSSRNSVPPLVNPADLRQHAEFGVDVSAVQSSRVNGAARADWRHGWRAPPVPCPVPGSPLISTAASNWPQRGAFLRAPDGARHWCRRWPRRREPRRFPRAAGVAARAAARVRA